jgi:hypothetical protein
MKPGTVGSKRRIDNWAKRMLKTEDVDIVSREMVTQGLKQGDQSL